MHGIGVLLLRLYMRVLKLVVRVIPMDWPRLFEGSGSSLERRR